jgi:hypothetical protein
MAEHRRAVEAVFIALIIGLDANIYAALQAFIG